MVCKSEECFSALTDEEIITLAQKGDQTAVEYMTSKYIPYVRNKSRSYFLVGGDGEDIVQEGLIGLYEAIKDYCPDKQASFKTFMDICVTRQIMTAIKTASRQKHIPLNTYVSLNKPLYHEDSDRSFMEAFITSKKEDPESLYLDVEKTHEINEEIKKTLSRFEHQVLELYLQGVSYYRIAEVLEKEEKAIDNAIQRIRKKLSRNLEIT